MDNTNLNTKELLESFTEKPLNDFINDEAFNAMQYATQDKTSVALQGEPDRISSDDVHNMLMAAGMTPGIGNAADLADAVLYATEGEFGSAALSAASMLPIVGQMVSAKKALKVAKDSGEEMVTLYRGVRGVDDVNVMVKNGKVVGNWGRFDASKAAGQNIAELQGRKVLDSVMGPLGPIHASVPRNINTKNTLFTSWKKSIADRYKGRSGMLLEFEIPK